jgi:hypothetical protein
MTCLNCPDDVYIAKRQLCKRCYMEQWRAKNYTPTVKRTPFERFIEKVQKTDTCWNWFGHRNPKGYGKFGVMYAHRWSYEHYKRAIPEGWQIDHLCRNTSCVNPDHLEAVTLEENVRRQHGEPKIYCHLGHQRTWVSGRLRCYDCQSMYKKSKRHASKRGAADVSF